MLDIGIIIPELAKYGGAERVLIECIARWQYQHKLTIYTTRWDMDILREHGVEQNLRLVRLAPYFEGDHAVLLNGTLLPKIWEQKIGEHQIYHTHLWPTHLIDRHPMVWFPHEPPRMLQDLRYSQPADEDGLGLVHCYPKLTYDNMSNLVYDAALNVLSMFDKLGRPDRIVANSRHTAKYLEAVYATPVMDVVYPGVNVAEVPPSPAHDNIFLTVGQLWPHKRIKMLIEAIHLVQDAQLYIIGNGPERKNLLRVVETLGLSERVRFLHNVTNQTLQTLYARCLGVVFAAIAEPFGIAPLEALAAGKPLIAVNEGGYTEVVDDSCAFLVPPCPVNFAARMAYLIKNKDFAQQMGRIGLQKAKSYTWDHTATQLLQIIEQTHHAWELKKRDALRTTGQPSEGPLFGIQYYCWYGHGAGSRHWNDNGRFGGVTDMPSLGYYASSDGSAIEQQLQAMEQIGLDFVILNWHVDANGVSQFEWVAMNRLLGVAEKMGCRLKFAIQLCLYDCTPHQIMEALAFIRELTRKKWYQHLHGQPLLFIFWTGALDQDQRQIELLREHSTDWVRVATSLRMYAPRDESHKTFGLFHGWSLFSPLELGGQANWESLWTQAYRNASAGTLGLRVLTLAPGYDDGHLDDPNRSNNPYRVIEREHGKTYQRMMEFALSIQDRPDLILVSTFNEYHENTHIESSLHHGSLYMELTGQFIVQAREKWAAHPSSLKDQAAVCF